MHTRSRIELLGGLCIEQTDRIITHFRTQKTGALLAYLAYYRERSHPREQLIELLWPEADLDSGRNSLSRALSSLRHQLERPGVPHGAILRADRLSVQLNPEAVTTDVGEFDAALHKAAKAGSARERMLFLADAAELYSGELLPGHYEEWCLVERERLAETYLRTLHQLIERLERTGDLDHALGYARRAVSADPLREEAYQDIMRLLTAAGQPTLALRHYRELEQRLEEQLGEAPSTATLQLAREIERQSAGYTVTGRQTAGPRADAAPPPPALPSRLPTGTVTFLLTDIEGSTAQWERQGEAFTAALASHHTLLRRTFRCFGGYEVKEAGDGFIVAFACARDALACAVASQQALADYPWPEEVAPLRVRMALHSGDVVLQEGDYHGLVLHHASRMLAAGHEGQILCSEATAAVVQRNLEPGIRLTDLGVYRLRDVEMPERLFQVEYPEMAQRVFPPPRAEARYARNLPLKFTRFIGRERELGQLEGLLLAEQTRLVTLTSAGGTGKSRLALESASRLFERFSGAVWFVPLADLAEAGLVVDAVQQALRLPRSPAVEPLEQVVEMLSQQPSLLVLDNFEHLVDEGASLVQTLLERVPLLKCLVTSRQRLDLSAEREYVVPPLQTPEGGDAPAQLGLCESVRLFIDRAQVVKSDFQVTNRNAPALAELCQRLEGIPLAIELAAARAQVLTPTQMLNQLAHRFDFLVSRRRDGAKRHQTLHAAVDWSYRLLTPELQRFFARLSVFRGGWTVEAAEAVCEAPLALDYLAQLRDCSLVLAEEAGEERRPSAASRPLGVPWAPDPAEVYRGVRDGGRTPGETIRFRMLETLREYGAEQLTAAEAADLARRHADFFLALAERWRGQGIGWERLERDHDNFRAVLAGAVERGDAETGWRLAGALMGFWMKRRYLTEGREHLAELLALPEVLEGTAMRAEALGRAADLARIQGDYGAARALGEESLAIGRILGDKRGITRSLLTLGQVTREQGDYETARVLYEEIVTIYQELGDDKGIALSLHGLGWIASHQGDYEAAEAVYKKSLAILRALGDVNPAMRDVRWGIAESLDGLGSVARVQGNCERAQACYEEALAIARELDGRDSIACSLLELGDLARDQGDTGRARVLYEESLVIFRGEGERREIAACLYRLALMAAKQGESERAATLLEESLTLIREQGNKTDIEGCLTGCARLAAELGQRKRAAGLFGAAEALREAIGAPTKLNRREEDEAHLVAIRATLGEEAFAAAWAKGRALTMQHAISYALEPPENE